VVVLLATLVFAASAGALDPPYLDEMPSVERVLREIQGQDRLDTLARQVAAFEQLMKMVEVMAGKRRFRLTRDEQRIKAMYNTAFWKMQQDTLNSFDPAETKRLAMESPRAKWWELETRYSHDPALRDEILQRFFSPAWQASYRAALGQGTRAPQAALNPGPPEQSPAPGSFFDPVIREVRRAFPGVSPMLVISIGIIGSGLLLAWCVRRELQPFGLDPSDPSLLRSGHQQYQIHTSTGIVRNPTKAVQTTTRVSSDPQGHVSSSTTTTVHVQFFIQERDGTERSVQLVNVNLALREGHLLSAAWAIKKGKDRGPYFLFLNHSTAEQHLLEGTLRPLLRMWKRPVLPLALLTLFLPPLFMDTLLIPALVVFFVFRFFVNRSRWKRFKNVDLPVITDALARRAQEHPR
jgi:hypothetical protein